MALENYIKKYTGFLQEVRKETYEKHQNEAEMLFEFIDNWIDLIPRDEEKFSLATNSLSGMILLNSWKLTNWITYEILNGKYFEGIRNLRFVFEGCVYAVIVEDAIESKVFEKWGSLSTLSFKAEVFRLWEECKRMKVCKKGKVSQDKINRLAINFVNRNIDTSRIIGAQEYIEVYVEILSNMKLYLSTSKMIRECASFLRFDEKDVEEVKGLWHELSRHLHFSYEYLEAIIGDPQFCFSEKLDDKLFKSSLTLYFQTLDFLYTVLVWRFPNLRKEIRKMCEWWKDNFNKSFSLAEKTLNSLQE